MQKLKSMIKKVINTDPLDICKHNNPTSQDFSLVIHSYQSMSFESKRLFSESLSRKLSRPHQNKQTLNLLILCDFLSGTNPQIFTTFPKKMLQDLEQKKKIKAWTKQEKLNLAQTNFIYFYLEYLRQKIWSQASHMDNLAFNTLQDGTIYCQSAINGLKLVLRYDFIIEYTLINSQLKQQTRISLQNILRRSSEDLAILIKFVDKWCTVITQDRPQSLMVNDIYEQLIYVSKNISKLEYLRNKIKAKIALPRYELNKNLNLTIQKSMKGRESERISFYSQKRLKTDGDTNEEQAEITETEIFMKFKL